MHLLYARSKFSPGRPKVGPPGPPGPPTYVDTLQASCLVLVGRRRQARAGRDPPDRGPAARTLSQVIRLCLRFGVGPVFIPAGEPQFNGGVENFNGWFQEPLFQRRFHRPGDLRRELAWLQEAVNTQHVHPRRDVGRAPDSTSRSTSRLDHVRAVRAGDDVHEVATLDEERSAPAAIPRRGADRARQRYCRPGRASIGTPCPALLAGRCHQGTTVAWSSSVLDDSGPGPPPTGLSHWRYSRGMVDRVR